MLGTLVGALEARKVPVSRESIACRVEGEHAVRDGLPVLAAVRVHYRLQVPAGMREGAERALARHLERCPTAASLRGAVEVSYTAELVET